MLKVITIVGTRPEIIRLSRVMARLDQVFDHKIIHTGQNYDFELNQIFFDELEINRPNHFLNARGSSAIETIANILISTQRVLEQEKPDAVLVLGDTNSAMSVICAKRLKIPIFHMEAGNRCFDQRVPEEINRRIVDHISDVNLTYTEHARRNLLAEGLPEDRIFKTGSPQAEVLDFYRSRIDSSKVLLQLGVEAGKYFVVSIHREENVDNHEYLKNILDSLLELKKNLKNLLIF